VGRLFLHHTATPEWTGVDAVRRVHRIALDRGFLEIGYSWLIDVAGNQIEGRGWGFQGAHTVGFNSTAHAISLVGNFEANRVPERMVQAAAGLVRRHGAQRWGPGRTTNVHRDVAPTSCPGRNAIAIVGRVNRIAAGGGGGGDGEMLERGDRGKYVRKMQQWLGSCGMALEAEGQFGRGTELAVKVFQDLTWLPTDGIYDSLVTAPQLAARVEAIRNGAKPKFTRRQIDASKRKFTWCDAGHAGWLLSRRRRSLGVTPGPPTLRVVVRSSSRCRSRVRA
jgi:hypothetical protein